MRIVLPFLLLLILLCACSADKPTDQQVQPTKASSNIAFTVNVDGLRLRSEPGPDGRPLQELKYGTQLVDLGEVSSFTTRLSLRGIPFNEPWIRVRTPQGQEGWVYAGALNFTWNGEQGLSGRLMEIRLSTLFGEEGFKAVSEYRQAFHTIGRAADFARVYRQGMALRENLVEQLDKYLALQAGEELPDLFWLQQAFPGFQPQRVAEGTAYYLFADYRQWLPKARQTAELEDDDFTKICLAAFPEDSVEYFFPAWIIQTWDYGGHSLLGRGVHRSLIGRIDTMLTRNTLFRPEAEKIKTQLVQDIAGINGITYWESSEAIVKELEQILAEPYSCLSRTDRVALEGRLQQFRDPAANGIVVNLRSGE